MEALQPGDPQAVGRYALLGRLGVGGMGVVYLARGPDGELAAVKVVHPAFAAQPEFRARFAREVAALREVHGPFTAELLDADPQAATPWLAMAYVPGPTLQAQVDTCGPLPADRVLAVATGVAGALGMLHRRGWVHRDLKPGNVILSADGPRVIDLGIAHAVGATALTQTGAVVGTRTWMAPEQLTGAGETPATDMFAWACLVVYAATGHHPFGTGRPEAVGLRILHGPPRLVGLAHLDEPLVDCVARCLAGSPAQRPTAGQVLAALTGHPDDDPTVLDHDGPAMAPGWPTTNGLALDAPPAAPLGGPAPASPAPTPNLPPAGAGPAANPAAQPPPQPPPRWARRALAVSVTLVLGALGGGLFLLLRGDVPGRLGREEPVRAAASSAPSGTPSTPTAPGASSTSTAPAETSTRTPAASSATPKRPASPGTADPSTPAGGSTGRAGDEPPPGGLEPIGPPGSFPLSPKGVQATLLSRTTDEGRVTIKGTITRADAVEHCTRTGSWTGTDTPAKVKACADAELAAERGEVYEATAKCAQELLRPPRPSPQWRHDDPDRSVHWWRLAVPDGEEGAVGDATGEWGTQLGPVWQDTTTGELADSSNAGGGSIMWLQFQVACDPG